VQDYLNQVFADDGSRASALSRLDQVLERAGAAQVVELRRLIDPDNELSPLARWRGEIVNELARQGQEIERALTELAKEVAVNRATATAHSRTAIKGAEFEALVGPLLQAIASPRGDIVDPVGKTQGLSGSDLGDYTVTLAAADTGGAGASYVVEAKDKKGMSTRAALTELTRAMANRDALAGIIVFSSDTCPEPEPVSVFEDDKIIVALDKHNPDPHALRLACLIARWTARRRASETDADTLDVERLRGLIEAARRALKRTTQIKTQLSAAEKGISGARSQLTDLTTDITTALEELETALTDPAAD